LRSLKSEGYDVRTVYGIEDAVKIAVENQRQMMLFLWQLVLKQLLLQLLQQFLVIHLKILAILCLS
jgi:hypothetical protein